MPEQALAHAVPLARGTRELEGCMHHVGGEAHRLRHALHKVGVPAAEGADGQDAAQELAIIAPARQLRARGLHTSAHAAR